jgi:hypothetical protein
VAEISRFAGTSQFLHCVSAGSGSFRCRELSAPPWKGAGEEPAASLDSSRGLTFDEVEDELNSVQRQWPAELSGQFGRLS